MAVLYIVIIFWIKFSIFRQAIKEEKDIARKSMKDLDEDIKHLDQLKSELKKELEDMRVKQNVIW